MKRVLMQLAAAVMLLSLSTAPALAQARIATVDLGKIFNNYWKTKQADTALHDRQADLRKEGLGLESDLKKANDDYKQMLEGANDQAVSAEERDKRKTAAEAKLKDIKSMEDNLQQFERQMQTTLQEQQRRMRENILSEIRDTITARGKSAGYAMVIASDAQTASETPVILYNNNENDLTDAVLTQLNAGAPVDASTPSDKSDTKPTGTKPSDSP
jgi:outer membrane protein